MTGERLGRLEHHEEKKGGKAVLQRGEEAKMRNYCHPARCHRRRGLRWPLLALAVGLAAGVARLPVLADDNADHNLYVDYVAGPWDDWSWDTNRDWKSSEHAFSFEHAAKLSFVKAYGAVRLHYRGADPRGL